jgi:hypothetical protein
MSWQQRRESLQLDKRLTRRHGKSTIYWSYVSDEPITALEASGIQTLENYHPNGYGFSEFKCGPEPVLGGYMSTWKCWASCD